MEMSIGTLNILDIKARLKESNTFSVRYRFRTSIMQVKTSLLPTILLTANMKFPFLTLTCQTT